MIDPLFDRNLHLVGWIDPNRHIFDLDLNWVAYISGGNVWSPRSGAWLGPIDGRACMDQQGNPVAWNPKDPVRIVRAPSFRPFRPLRPLAPLRPIRPVLPLPQFALYYAEAGLD